MKRGRWYIIDWVDACAGSGDALKAEIYVRRIIARFVGWGEKEGIKYAKLALLEEEDNKDFTDTDWYGMPKCMIVDTEELNAKARIQQKRKGTKTKGRPRGGGPK